MTKRENESNEILSQIYNLVLNPDINVCVNLFYAKFRNLTCTAYLEMF